MRKAARRAPLPCGGDRGRVIFQGMDEFTVRPDPADPRLTQRVKGVDQDGREIETAVVMERPLTLYLNGQEIVTMMTIGDYPEYLAVGYLINQNMLKPGRRGHRHRLRPRDRHRRRAHEGRARISRTSSRRRR